MANLCFVLTKSPFQLQNFESLCSLADASLAADHEVSLFLFLDGVYAPMKTQSRRDSKTLPREVLRELMRKGAKILACDLSSRTRGLDPERDFISGVATVTLPEFGEMLGRADRLVSF